MNKIIIILFLVCPQVFALSEERAYRDKNFVIIHDPSIKKESVQKFLPGTIVFDRKDQLRALRGEAMLIEEQNKMFHETGLTRYVSKFDQFDKDMMVRRLRGFQPKFLQKKYKNLKLETILKAKAIIAKYDRETIRQTAGR